MIESQAQRTLVKSPPELWAEVSDPAALARHLGEIAAEIRITRMEPERSVAWEGDRASGRVELAPSGWGTKVLLTLQAVGRPSDPPDAGGPDAGQASGARPVAPDGADAAAGIGAPRSQADAPRDDPGDGHAPAEAPAANEPDATIEPVVIGTATATGGPDAVGASQAAREPDATGSAAAAPVAGGPGIAPHAEPVRGEEAAPSTGERRGFFSRLFGRRARRGARERSADPPAPAGAPSAEAESPTRDGSGAAGVGRPRPLDATAGAPAPTPDPPVTAAPISDLAPRAPAPEDDTAPDATEAAAPEDGTAPDATEAVVEDGEALDEAQATAALAAMLDSLGSAHHRPFSRS